MKRTLKRFILPLSTLVFLKLWLPHSLSGEDSDLRIHFLDVGYGDSILIESAHGVLLVDAGEKKYAQRLLDYLSDRRIHTIDVALITHPHKNHFEGFLPLLKKVKIRRLFINGDKAAEEGYEDVLSAFAQRNIPIQTLKAGVPIDAFSTDLSIEILHPGTLSSDPNGNSLVTWIKFKETYSLLTADISEQQANQLIATKPFIRKAHVVQIPHHGGSVAEPWTTFFDHPIFVISTGRNPWGIPDAADLKKLNGRVWRTDLDGTIVLESDGRSVRVRSPQRRKAR